MQRIFKYQISGIDKALLSNLNDIDVEYFRFSKHFDVIHSFKDILMPNFRLVVFCSKYRLVRHTG